MSALSHDISADIRNFIEQQQELIFNESDFQLQLSAYLVATGKYDGVQLEYFIPNGLAADAGYDWDSNLYIDIVCHRGDSYCPIELKYPTKRVVKDAVRFGKQLMNVEMMRNQGAQNIIRYNFWKDVRRIEIIKYLFPKVKKGIAVMLTNDTSYITPMRLESAASPFSTHQGHIVGGDIMDWQNTPAVRRDHKPFRLDGKYSVNWSEHLINNEKFYLTTIII